MGSKIPLPVYPYNIEAEYIKVLFKRVKLQYFFLEILLNGQVDLIKDSKKKLKNTLKVKNAQKAFEKKHPIQKEEKKLEKIISNMNMHVIKELENQTKTIPKKEKKQIPAIQVELSKNLSKTFIDENVSLIKSLDKRFFDDIEQVVSESVKIGRSTEVTAKLLQERYQVSKSRAKLIARDQISKLNGLITQEKQQDLGIKKYEWATAGDERVRATHRRNDGKTFSWSKPPATGHPGQDIQCRCVALPVFK